MKNLYLIVGPSGSGKTTLADNLEKYLDTRSVKSYTTRPPREHGERSHTFISPYEFEMLSHDLVARTKFDGYEYGVTKTMLDKCGLYVIDPVGALDLLEHYNRIPGDIIVIWLDASSDTCRWRMSMDGRSQLDIQRRLLHDAEAFGLTSYTSLLMAYGMLHMQVFDANGSKDDVMMKVANFITECEAE